MSSNEVRSVQAVPGCFLGGFLGFLTARELTGWFPGEPHGPPAGRVRPVAAMGY
jgi:hypothetical protein